MQYSFYAWTYLVVHICTNFKGKTFNVFMKMRNRTFPWQTQSNRRNPSPKCTVMRETPDVGETEDDLTCGPHSQYVELYFWAYIVIQSRQDSTYLCTFCIHPVETLMITNLGSLVFKQNLFFFIEKLVFVLLVVTASFDSKEKWRN